MTTPGPQPRASTASITTTLNIYMHVYARRARARETREKKGGEKDEGLESPPVDDGADAT